MSHSRSRIETGDPVKCSRIFRLLLEDPHICAVNWPNRGDFSNVNLWSRFNDLVESSFRIVSLPASRSINTDTDGIMDSRSTRLPNHRQPAVFMSPKMPEAVFLYGSRRNLALRDAQDPKHNEVCGDKTFLSPLARQKFMPQENSTCNTHDAAFGRETLAR